jgi:hypothetical protein
VIVPEPTSDDAPFNEPVQVSLAPGEKGTLKFTPEQSDGRFYLPILAMSKRAHTVYKARADGRTIYGPATIPPTDIDDLGVCFLPSREFEQQLVIEITRLSTASGEQPYDVQPVGFERGGDS